ncbi:hypothetical protein BDW60DRAFT_177378 [Aspergillus nidulans var. acristatus]
MQSAHSLRRRCWAGCQVVIAFLIPQGAICEIRLRGWPRTAIASSNPETLVVPLPTARVSNHIRDPLPGILRVLKRLETG